MPHGCHIYNTTEYMAMEKMCPCTYEHHGITHWKYVLRCCDKYPSIVLPSQEEINIQQSCVQQYNFIFTVMYPVVVFTEDIHTMNKQHVHCVPQ